jgi:hypothetical protein
MASTDPTLEDPPSPAQHACAQPVITPGLLADLAERVRHLEKVTGHLAALVQLGRSTAPPTPTDDERAAFDESDPAFLARVEEYRRERLAAAHRTDAAIIDHVMSLADRLATEAMNEPVFEDTRTHAAYVALRAAVEKLAAGRDPREVSRG